MRRTKKPPTKPGAYWGFSGEFPKGKLYEVYACPDGCLYLRGLVYLGQVKQVSESEAMEWCGPLLPPKIRSRKVKNTAAIAYQDSQPSELKAAAQALLDHYVSLVRSGDAGNWDPETEEPVIRLRKALEP